jgi:seryl-tRNA synthetase
MAITLPPAAASPTTPSPTAAPSTAAPQSAGADEVAAFRDALLRHGLLVSTGVPGLFGKGAAFETVLLRFEEYVSAAGAVDGAEVLRFPPVVSRAHFERSGYLKSFPHLAGAVHSFAGGDAEHAALLRCLEDGGDWSEGLAATGVVLAPAACYPVYPHATGTLPAGGRLFDVSSYCFRHEPSPDPARMQAFRMHEWVRLGEPDDVRAFRDLWLERSLELLAALGLDARADVANDPFFGRAGRMLAATQREQSLKFELLVTVASSDRPTAVVSCNYHQDHFGQRYDIRTAAGEPAHSACVGFGLERITLALFRRHGFDTRRWPAVTRAALRL